MHTAKMIGIGAIVILAVILITLLVVDGVFLERKYLSVWDQKYLDSLDADQERLIACALRASSSHNLQPWLVKMISDQTIELYADMNKKLTIIDEGNQQMLISQGAFIEEYVIAAQHYGYQVEVALKQPDFNQPRPLIATLTIEKGGEPGALDLISSATVSVKQSDKNLEEDVKKALAPYSELRYQIVVGEDLDTLKNSLMEATIAESHDQAAMEELLKVFRWTEWDKNELRDGLTLRNMNPLMQHLIQPLMKIFPSDWKGFGEQGIAQFRDRLLTESAYVLIDSKTTDSYAYLNTGRAYQRLCSEISGYTIRPAVQLVETYGAVKQWNESFQVTYGNDGEVLFLFGAAEQNQNESKSQPGPRHLVKDIMIE